MKPAVAIAVGLFILAGVLTVTAFVLWAIGLWSGEGRFGGVGFLAFALAIIAVLVGAGVHPSSPKVRGDR